MLSELVFHHIGIATFSIANTAKYYTEAGYKTTDIISDHLQKVNICLISKAGFPLIELIEPTSNQSPVKNIVNKLGVTPYHLCYETDDIYEAIRHLKINKFILIFKPIPAAAFENRLICFLYNKEVGFIELLQAN
ncbi:MAG: VOC family protein [Bacteroidetes bacterium]|nr:VOC family protein [Bacteroidota bacterium]